MLDSINGTFSNGENTTVNGGHGADFLVGSDGPEKFIGAQGDDSVVAGGGDDLSIWNPGDGNDSFVGQAGTDTLDFNGANVSEKIAVGPTDAGVHVTRDVSNVAVDTEQVELLDLSAIGGADTITAGNLAGHVKLKIDAGSGDDSVIGSDGPDTISGGDGSDLLRGRQGEDTINGNGGPDQLFGGAGHDTLDGGDEADAIACGGTGDTFARDPFDTIAPDCFTDPTPPAPPPGPGTSPAPSDPGSPPPPSEPGSPPADPGSPAPLPPQPPVRGFAKPVVKATHTGLVVKLHNTSDAPIKVKLVAVESKRHYKTVTTKLGVGARVTLKLKAPHALRKRIARKATRRPKLTVLNVANGIKLTLRPRL